MSRSLAASVDRNVGYRIRAFRVGVGISLAQLASDVGVNVSELENWERGVARPSPRHLFACATSLKVHVGEFFGNF